MGREVRRVPADWQHPKDGRGRYIPLLGRSASEAVANWEAGEERWAAGWREQYFGSEEAEVDAAGRKWCRRGDDTKDMPYEDWTGPHPKPEDHMPDFKEPCTHWQMYEDCSEGTPISPVIATPEELAHWLADNAASAFGGMTATYDQWLATVKRGWAVSAVLGPKGFVSGVEDG